MSGSLDIATTPNEPVLLTRRAFIATTGAVAAATALAPSRLSAAPAAGELIDTNVSLGQWPFRRAPLDDPSALVAKLREHGVTEAWTGSFDALLHKDISGVNARLVADCKRHGGGLLMPIGAVNPKLPGWAEDMRRCAEVHRMRGIRLHPNYHGYTLADPLAAEVLERAAQFRLLVQIAVALEDERTIHPLVNVPAVNTAPLGPLMKKIPTLRVQLLNAFRAVRVPQAISLAAQRVAFDLTMLDGVEAIANLLQQFPAGQLCFGSYAPVFYFEAAMLKLRESVLSESQLESVRFGSARRLVGRP
jgi:predicted TIM-barrel fold metal-dependent hydrolase